MENQVEGSTKEPATEENVKEVEVVEHQENSGSDFDVLHQEGYPPTGEVHGGNT